MTHPRAPVSEMSREELEALRNSVHAAEMATGRAVVHMPGAKLLALLAMAERAVSVETVRKLAEAIELDDERFDAANGGIHYEAARLSKESRAAMAAFHERARLELKPAAEALKGGPA